MIAPATSLTADIDSANITPAIPDMPGPEVPGLAAATVAMHDQQWACRVEATTIALDDIVEMKPYLRTIDPAHVENLRENIRTIGLEHGLVLINGNVLIVGHHRYHALMALRQQYPDRFQELFKDGQIPVRVYTIGDNPEAILALRISENCARRDVSTEDVASAFATLMSMHGHTNKRGRPAKGETAIGPEIQRLFGISAATLTRMLREARRRENTSCEVITKSKRSTKAVDTTTTTVDGADADTTSVPAPMGNDQADADVGKVVQVTATPAVPEAQTNTATSSTPGEITAPATCTAVAQEEAGKVVQAAPIAKAVSPAPIAAKVLAKPVVVKDDEEEEEDEDEDWLSTAKMAVKQLSDDDMDRFADWFADYRRYQR